MSMRGRKNRKASPSEVGRRRKAPPAAAGAGASVLALAGAREEVGVAALPLPPPLESAGSDESARSARESPVSSACMCQRSSPQASPRATRSPSLPPERTGGGASHSRYRLRTKLIGLDRPRELRRGERATAAKSVNWVARCHGNARIRFPRRCGAWNMRFVRSRVRGRGFSACRAGRTSAGESILASGAPFPAPARDQERTTRGDPAPRQHAASAAGYRLANSRSIRSRSAATHASYSGPCHARWRPAAYSTALR